MNKSTHSSDSDLDDLLEHARALIAATADVAGDKVGDARKRLATALDSGKKIFESAKDRAVAGAQATDEAIRERPYHAIGIALGAGALIGYLLARRSSRSDN